MTGEARRAVGVPNVDPFGDPLLLVELAVAAEEHGWDGFSSGIICCITIRAGTSPIRVVSGALKHQALSPSQHAMPAVKRDSKNATA